MRAALFHAPGRALEVREIEIEEPGPDDVLVRMAAVGVCGSDLHVVRGEWKRATPMILGHEGAGVVAATGEGVTDLHPGDRVVVSWNPACGECGPCRAGRPTACLPLRAGIAAGTLPDGTTRLSLDGQPVYRMTAVGAFAEHVLMPQRAVLPVPDDLTLEQAALLGCAALTGVGAVVNAARVPGGGTVVVVGAGGVGGFAIQGARIAGAATVVAVDPSEARRVAALEIGATHAVAPDGLADLLASLAGDGADVAIEAVGASATVTLALAAVRPTGTVVLAGIPPAGVRLDLDPAEFVHREKVLTGTVYGSQDPAVGLPGLLDHVRAGRLDLQSALGPSYPLDRIDEAIDAALAGVAGRVLVTP